MSLTDGGAGGVQIALEPTGRARSRRMSVVRAQLQHLFPAADVPLHLGYGPPPAGFRTVEAWRVIPDRAAPRALMPVRVAAARTCVLSHNRLRPPTVAACRLLAAAAMTPLALAQGGRGILRLSVPREVDDDTVDRVVITRHLRRLVPDAVDTAVSLRDFHPRAKPTVQLLDRHGAVVGFAKVASDGATGERVGVEARLLAELGPPLDRPGSPVRLPRLLAAGRCGPFRYSVVQPLPARARRAVESDQHRVLRALTCFSAALGPRTQGPLSSTGLWREMTERLRSAQPARAQRPELVVALDRLAETVRRLDGDLVLPTGAYHGDWVPWNMAWDDATLWVWDLEYGSRDAPVGLDALRWVFQVQHVVHGAPFSAAVGAMALAAPRLLARLGVDPGVAPALVRLHVVDTVATALGLLAQGRGLPDGLEPDALDVMRAVRRLETA